MLAIESWRNSPWLFPDQSSNAAILTDVSRLAIPERHVGTPVGGKGPCLVRELHDSRVVVPGGQDAVKSVCNVLYSTRFSQLDCA